MYDGQIVEREGYRFRVTLERDDEVRVPWEDEDGHGPVSDWTRRGKAPGELVLCSDRGSKRFYDFAEAVRIARREGWDTAPYGQGTRGSRAARAARADFERLRRWWDGDWWYVGVVVTPLTDDDVAHGGPYSCWGVESDCDEHIEMIAMENIEEALCDLRAVADAAVDAMMWAEEIEPTRL